MRPCVRVRYSYRPKLHCQLLVFFFGACACVLDEGDMEVSFAYITRSLTHTLPYTYTKYRSPHSLSSRLPFDGIAPPPRSQCGRFYHLTRRECVCVCTCVCFVPEKRVGGFFLHHVRSCGCAKSAVHDDAVGQASKTLSAFFGWDMCVCVCV